MAMIALPNYKFDGGDMSKNADGSNSDSDQREETIKQKQTRRAVACKSCHGLKVKCTPSDVDNPAGPCLRCLNANRKCEIDLNQTRKRRKKAEILADTRDVKEEVSLPMVHSPSPKENTVPPTMDELKARIQHLEAVVKRQHDDLIAQAPALHNRDSSSDLGCPPFVSKFDLVHELNLLCDMSSKLTDTSKVMKSASERRSTLLNESREAVDCISHGIISIEDAQFRLDLYRNTIYPSHPLVKVPHNFTLDDLRREQPHLLNAIMSVTNAITDNKVDKDQLLKLDNYAILAITFEIMAMGTKSMELIRSLLLLCSWYNTPEFFKHRRYHLLNTISVTMLHDLGIIAVALNSATQASKDPTKLDEELPSIETPEDNEEHNSLVLIIYFTTVSICIILRRAIYVKWTPYIEECCTQLENLSDKRSNHIALYSRLSNQLERIHQIVHSPDTSERRPAASGYLIDEFQQALNNLKKKINADDHYTLAYFYTIEAYLHEPNLANVSMYDHTGDLRLSEYSMKLIANCNDSCMNALNEFNELSVLEAGMMPMFMGTRSIYIVGMLLRLRCLIMVQTSNIEKELVPRDALFAIQKCNTLVENTSNAYSNNYCVMKTRLIFQLFIQTYSSQIQELIKKNGTNFQGILGRRLKKLMLNAQKFAHMFAPPANGAKSIPPDVSNTAIPLDLLSFAATSYHGSEKTGSPLGSPTEELIFKSQSAGKNAWCHSSSAGKAPPTKYPPPQFNQQIPPILHQVSLLIPVQLPPHIQQHIPQQIPLPPQQLPPQPQHLQNRNPIYRNLDMPLHAANISNLANTVNIHNMASSELLENAYMAVNDEFWADLLSAEADKVNFSNNNTYSGSQVHEEIFYMK